MARDVRSQDQLLTGHVDRPSAGLVMIYNAQLLT